MRHLPHAAALAALLALPLPGLAQESAERGARLAQRWCDGCHLVTPGQRLAVADAPSFPAIARETEGDFGWLAPFLADPHPAMPRMSLSRQQIRDLGAYLAALREEAPAAAE